MYYYGRINIDDRCCSVKPGIHERRGGYGRRGAFCAGDFDGGGSGLRRRPPVRCVTSGVDAGLGQRDGTENAAQGYTTSGA